MRAYTFHWEMKDLIVQFIQALDDSIVKRYDENKDIEKEIEVKYVYAPKSRTLHWLVNKQQHIALPAVSIWIGGVSRDVTRVFNKIDGPLYINEDTMVPYQPVPVNISVNVSMLSKYQNDMDQMITNFVPYFDPYIVLSWNHPNVSREIRSEVEWDGSLSYKYPIDIPATEHYRCSVDTTFTIKGWMFKKAGDNSGPIYTITTNYIGSNGVNIEGIPFIDYDDFFEDLEMDTFVTEGIPSIRSTDPLWVNQEGGTLKVRGNFLKVDSMYLSGSSGMLSGDLEGNVVDLFSDRESLSADNPPFIGTEITTYTLDDDSYATVDIPSLGTTGFLDIIVLNEAGYGGIIKNADDSAPQKDGLFVI